VSEDPAGNGANWYAYCNNSPVCQVDPTGKAPNYPSFLKWMDDWGLIHLPAFAKGSLKWAAYLITGAAFFAAGIALAGEGIGLLVLLTGVMVGFTAASVGLLMLGGAVVIIGVAIACIAAFLVLAETVDMCETGPSGYAEGKSAVRDRM
jgi:hypothetical protein